MSDVGVLAELRELELLQRCSTIVDDALISELDEAAINLLVADSTGVVLAHGCTKRIATRSQTLALIARDGDCTFPGCGKPPEWCQRHHITAWADGGRTDLDNLPSA